MRKFPIEQLAEIMKAKEAYDAEHPLKEGGFLSDEEKEKIQSLVFEDYEHITKNY